MHSQGMGSNSYGPSAASDPTSHTRSTEQENGCNPYQLICLIIVCFVGALVLGTIAAHELNQEHNKKATALGVGAALSAVLGFWASCRFVRDAVSQDSEDPTPPVDLVGNPFWRRSPNQAATRDVTP